MGIPLPTSATASEIPRRRAPWAQRLRAASESLLANRVLGFLAIAAQLYAVSKLIQRFNIETAAFRSVFEIGLWGFAIHYWLPRAWQLRGFALLSLASLAVVLGMNPGAWSPGLAFERSAWLAGIGAALVGICLAPLAFRTRVALLALAAAGLAACRSGSLALPIPAPIWPLLGSMFMFRLILFAHELSHARERPGLAHSVAYFAMLPNVCFPLFPVVDFKTFGRSLFARDPIAIYQTGLHWMLRGIAHLILYRAVYYHFHLSQAQVETGADLAQYLLSNLLLYLRVSGQFHLVVGLLHLFGFDLPETNRRYFLASSFSDYWRRINIYWKDFITKLVYYPTFFRLKQIGATRAMLIATLVSFALSWLLHSWQWFWLRGRFPITAQDVVFWGSLGVAVAVNTLWESKHPRKRTLGTPRFDLREALGRGLRAALVFAVLCLLWSIWSCSSIAGWLDLWSVADLDTLWIALAAMGAVALAAIVPGIDAPPSAATRVAPGSSPLAALPRKLALCVAAALSLYALSRPELHARLSPEAAEFVRRLTVVAKPTGVDQQTLERGYYEELIDVGLVNSPLSELFMQRPVDWKRLEETPVMRPTGDYLLMELTPGMELSVNGVPYRINRAGMRDDDYAREKPAGSCRYALLGASTVMGHGVPKQDSFEPQLELRFGRERRSERCRSYEFLNFGVNRYSPLSQIAVLEQRALPFAPDVVLYFAHITDAFWAMSHLSQALRAGAPLPDPWLAALAARAGITAAMPEESVERRLRPHWQELLAFAYGRIAELAAQRGALPVWVFLPRIGDTPERLRDLPQQRELAAKAGFAVIDLSSVFDPVAIDAISIAPWDRHPNALGHRLMLDALDAALREQPRLRALGLVGGAADRRARGARIAP